ncbi:MAG: EVE domain-containing protein [Phycisphaerales bacterium]|nr:EVE domain-containing protein [Phycisphaerales bacterium]
MNHWLVKSDPDDYSAHDLERDGATTWDGVRNPVAQRHMRGIRAGDAVFVYHTGKEKAIVAQAEATSDGGDSADGLAAVGLRFLNWLDQPVTLKAVKEDPSFKDFALVRQGRLSVMPVTPDQWKRLLKLAN